MRARGAILVSALLLGASGGAQQQPPQDAASAFGARESILDMSLSPDGKRVAYVTPAPGQAAALFTLELVPGAKAVGAVVADGKPWRLGGCTWVSSERLVCRIYTVVRNPWIGPMGQDRLVAVNADGSNNQLLSTRENMNTYGYQLGGGHVIDWLAGEDDAVLMTRIYLPDDRLGTRIGSDVRGLGVDRVDTRTVAVTRVLPPRHSAIDYISDGRGQVRIMAMQDHDSGGMSTGTVRYLYRAPGGEEWRKLSEYDWPSRSGFRPEAVDPDLNVAYGFKKLDGRIAVYTVKLDDSLAEELVYARPDVDVTELLRVGRRGRVVGAAFVTDRREIAYFSPEFKKLVGGLARALPKTPLIGVVDASADEKQMLIFAGSDSDPGTYYILDRESHSLESIVAVRRTLGGARLASVRSVSYPADDGTMIPGYLTLPLGEENARGLPAIVLPHGGPGCRDEWGFDWLSQYFAARGYAVLQPNFRGSAGYGDAWFQRNGFQSWQVAVGDVLAGGRWLVREGIADPARLGILGWSYGGYAALQSAVMDASVFKAVVAIAPVSDLAQLKEEHRDWTDFDLVTRFVGEGPHVRAGSPAQQAERIKVPVLLFHGTLDGNVSVEQSRRMDARLKAAGVAREIVVFDGLDHYLTDSDARAEMLRRSDAFLRKAFGG